jgi:hypothetical protein
VYLLVLVDPPISLGYEAVSRGSVDEDSGYWTFVSKEPFAGEGEIRSFEMFVGGPGRALRIGIYKPRENSTCEFDVLQQREWTGFYQGHQTVECNLHSKTFYSYSKTL